MKAFWEGFEKRAVWEKFEKAFVKKIRPKKSFMEASREAIDNINEAASGIREGTKEIRQTVPGVRETIGKHGDELKKTVGKHGENIKKVVDEKTNKALKYLKRGGLGALGIYGAGKALSAPADIERYRYYHQQRRLSKKQLQQLQDPSK